MTWVKTVQTPVGVMAYPVYNGQSPQGEAKIIRLHVGSSFADLSDQDRRDLAEYLLQGLEDKVS